MGVVVIIIILVHSVLEIFWLCMEMYLCLCLCFTWPTFTTFLFARELYVWLEMVPSSGTDFRKTDAGAARYT